MLKRLELLHKENVWIAEPVGDGDNLSATHGFRYLRVLELLPGKNRQLRRASRPHRPSVIYRRTEPPRLRGKVEDSYENESRKSALERKRQAARALRELVKPTTKRRDSEACKDA